MLHAWLSLMGFAFYACSSTPTPTVALADTAFAELERQSGGRLGVAALDTGTGAELRYRAQERFAMCSTFKALLAAAVLTRTCPKAAGMSHDQWLQHRVHYDKSVLLHHSPVTEQHLADGMTVAELCDASVRYSDNAAANLLLDLLGGPAAFTSFMRSLGDDVTRLDRTEPELSSAVPGDPRDTTTPLAMLHSLRRVVLDTSRSLAQRDLLRQWLLGNTTGAKRIRAGTPVDWMVGDKTGTGDHGATHDIAVLWPPQRAPIVLTVYFAEAAGSSDQRSAIVAEATRIALAALHTLVHEQRP